MKQVGIYRIINKVNNKIYIGQTIDFEGRKRKHINCLNSNSHKNNHLQYAWNKYGQDNFVFELIECCTKDELTKREQYWIDYYGGTSSNSVYNLKEAGNSGTFTEEVRKRIGEANKHKVYKRGFHLSEETKQKISDKLKGRECVNKWYRHTEETKRRIGEASKNRQHRKWTEEEKRIQSEKFKGRPAPNKGKPTGKAHKVFQLSLDGKIVAEYPSTTVACKETNYNPGCISKCCRGLSKTMYGYIWRYDKPEI